MVSLLLRYLDQDVAEADDVAQEVYLAVFRSLDTFRQGDDFGAWFALSQIEPAASAAESMLGSD